MVQSLDHYSVYYITKKDWIVLDIYKYIISNNIFMDKISRVDIKCIPDL